MEGAPLNSAITGDAASDLAAPADPSVWRRPYDWRAAIPAAVIAALALAALLIAASLEPDPAGVATHTQLGIEPCGFLQRTGMPCATCGMTTAFALAADGDLITAFVTQPAGALLAVITAIVAVVGAYAAFAGLSLLPLAAMCWRPLTIIVLGAFVLSAWGYKIITMHGV